jgi:hypothetical protein
MVGSYDKDRPIQKATSPKLLHKFSQASIEVGNGSVVSILLSPPLSGSEVFGVDHRGIPQLQVVVNPITESLRAKFLRERGRSKVRLVGIEEVEESKEGLAGVTVQPPKKILGDLYGGLSPPIVPGSKDPLDFGAANSPATQGDA